VTSGPIAKSNLPKGRAAVSSPRRDTAENVAALGRGARRAEDSVALPAPQSFKNSVEMRPLASLSTEGQLDAAPPGRTIAGMDHDKKKSSGSREVSKKAPPLGLVIALAAAGGVVIGSAGTYFLFKPLPEKKESAPLASPAVDASTQAHARASATRPRSTGKSVVPGARPLA
jgi:hypothetical protein